VTGVAPDLSAAHLLGRAAVVEARVAALVARRRAGDPDPDDGFRGLYVSDAQADALLAGGTTQADALLASGAALAAPAPDPAAEALLAAAEADADAAEAAGADLRLRRLARAFGLDPFDVELLLVALAPDLDPRLERLYGYLNDDVSRRRASAGLALELCGAPRPGGAQRARLGPAGPLVAGGLVLVEDPDRPSLTRALRVPDRVTAHLLGDDHPADPVPALAVDPVPAPLDGVGALARSLAAGTELVYVREPTGAAGLSLAGAALAELDRPVVALDLHRLGGADEIARAAGVAAREARRRGGALVAGPVEALAQHGPAAVRAFAEAPGQVVLLGGRDWDPAWSRTAPLLVDAPVPTLAQRAAIWRARLGGPDLAAATGHFRLAPEHIARAADAARRRAEAAGRPLVEEDLRAGARAQNAAGLERLARRVEPRAGWDDLVLPGPILGLLHELTARVRHRERVLDHWGMGARSSRGRGVTALFAGDSGTGKTLSAEVVAADLGLDLYVIDLSTVVDKYIGETEKNLDRIFEEADRVNGVLLFDEADALFGKRSEVRDARDRYANVEVSYLLQRMERFEGLAILTTNLRANVDEAFTRRLDAVVDVPLPDEHDRRRLWETHLRPTLPRAADVDLPFLAGAFKLSGGNIRNIALTAAYLAASTGGEVTMTHLITATEREYRKLGRMTVPSEFGPYHRLLAGQKSPGV